MELMNLKYVCPFSVAKVWNDLPQQLRLFPRLWTDTFLGHMKTYLLHALELGALLSSYLDGVLYKFVNELMN